MLKYVAKFVTSNWGRDMALSWISNIMIAIHVSLGVAVVAGGSQRFAIPTYQPLIDLVNGQTWIWGAWILIAALFMSIPTKWPQVIGLWIGMCWHIMWCACFAVAVVKYSTAGATAAVVYGGLAAIDAALLTARVVEQEEES